MSLRVAADLRSLWKWQRQNFTGQIVKVRESKRAQWKVRSPQGGTSSVNNTLACLEIREYPQTNRACSPAQRAFPRTVTWAFCANAYYATVERKWQITLSTKDGRRHSSWEMSATISTRVVLLKFMSSANTHPTAQAKMDSLIKLQIFAQNLTDLNQKKNRKEKDA